MNEIPLTSTQKLDALRGGRSILVTFESTDPDSVRSEEIIVRQFPVRDYEQAFKISDDERKLAAFACKKPVEWLLGSDNGPVVEGRKAGPVAGVTPESYELIVQTMKEVNAGGFFKFSERRRKETQEQLLNLPQEILQAVAAKGVEAMQRASGSPSL